MTHYTPIFSLLVTLVLLAFIVKAGKSGRFVQDIPNERSLHSMPTPRVGGIALMAGVLSGWSLLIQYLTWWVVLPVAGLFVLSLLDDMSSLSAGTRLIGHFLAALVAVTGADISSLWIIPAILFTVWMTNLYNFMDGSDGLAGGMAIFGFGSYGAGAWMGGNEAFAWLNISVASAAFGFLFFNFHPARVFMGDAGSIPLGFLAAIFGLSGWQQGYWPFWFPLLVFSPFVVDATVTLSNRARRRERLSQAHRNHYYQRLVQMGLGHRNTALAEYALMLLVGVSALWGIGLTYMKQSFLLLGWGTVFLALIISIDNHWKEFQSAKKKVADA